MEIKDFVTETLVQINEAMKSCEERTHRTHWISAGVKGGQGVKFSLAVTNADSSEKSMGGKGGVSIKVVEAKLDASGKTASLSETVSHIEFTVKVG